METCPTFIWTEVRTTIVTIGICKHIAVVIIICFAREERCHCRTSETITDSWFTCTESRVLHDIKRHTSIEDGNIVPFRLPCFLSNHGSKTMLSNIAIISDIVLKCPVFVFILLLSAFILTDMISTQVNSWVEGLCMIPSKIPTQFCMPGEVLYRGDIKEEVTIEFLTSQVDVVHQSHSNRVRICKSFLAYR